jgi:GLPGLI family protein
MKQLFLLLSAIAINTIVRAQNSGTVYFKETAKLHFSIQGDAPPPANLPTERNAQMILYYTPEASLYMNDPNAKNESGMIEEETSDGANVHIKMDAPDNRTYCDLKNEKRIDQRDFMQRMFLIETDLKKSDWKITGNQKKVLEYPCQEATREQDGKKIVAWFTPVIPISTGPSSFCGLPGMVLEVNINDGDQIITATSIKADENSSKIVKPKEGKKVTEEEFNRIRDEKMKEMGIEPGSGNNVIIKINSR